MLYDYLMQENLVEDLMRLDTPYVKDYINDIMISEKDD